MDPVWTIIAEHPIVFLMVFLPISYLVLRDLFRFYRRRRRAGEAKKRFIESEKRLQALYKKLEENRRSLMEEIVKIDEAFPDAEDLKNSDTIADIDKKTKPDPPPKLSDLS